MEKLTDDYYEFIGVKRGDSGKKIKDACNKLLMKYHPDKCKDVWADGVTKRIYEIKEILLDSEKRKVYDKTLPEMKYKAQDEQGKRESQARKAKEDEERERKAREDRQKRKSNGEAKKQSSKKSFCDYCGEDGSLPFKCHRCNGIYCAEHRLPEEHDCLYVRTSQPDRGKPRNKPQNKADNDWIYRWSDIEKRITSGAGTLDVYICSRCKNIRDMDRFMCPHCRTERNIKCDWCGKHFCKECIEPYRHDCLEYARAKFKNASKETYGKTNGVDEEILAETKVSLWRKINSMLGFGK